MGTNLEELTKRLYEDGVGKAKSEAESIISDAEAKSEKMVADATAEAAKIIEKGKKDAEGMVQKAESEISMATRNAETQLKQTITNIFSTKVSSEMAALAMSDKEFVQNLIVRLVEKWDPAGDALDLSVALPGKDKEDFEKFVVSKYGAILEKGLEIKVGSMKEGFSVGPKDGSFQLLFTEELFSSFFSQYLKGISKELLYK